MPSFCCLVVYCINNVSHKGMINPMDNFELLFCNLRNEKNGSSSSYFKLATLNNKTSINGMEQQLVNHNDMSYNINNNYKIMTISIIKESKWFLSLYYYNRSNWY